MESKQAAVEALMNSRRDKDFMIAKSSFLSRERGHLAHLSESEQIKVISRGAAIRRALWFCHESGAVAESSPPIDSDFDRPESQTPPVLDWLPLVGGFTQILFNPTYLHFRFFTFLEQVHDSFQVLRIHFRNPDVIPKRTV